MAQKHLLLWLEAPLQSWGSDSKFGRRDTVDFPTRSGVMGLVLCALGAGGPQNELLSRWLNAEMSVNAYTRLDKNDKAIAREKLLEDFHMVGSAYDEKDPWQSLFIPKTSEGKKQNGTGTKITYRYYLQDMSYAVLIKADSAIIDEAAIALQDPVWDIYLGRKCCVPTEFVFQGVFDNQDEINLAAEKLAAEKQRAMTYQVVEGRHDGEIITLNDMPIQFGQSKRYQDRVVTIQRLI
jgi:CRISPR system Cascade subunit CasD